MYCTDLLSKCPSTESVYMYCADLASNCPFSLHVLYDLVSSSTVMHWVFLDAARVTKLHKSLTLLSQLAYVGRNDEVICVSAACMARLWSWDLERLSLKDAAFCSESSKILVQCLKKQCMVSSMGCMIVADGTAGSLACTCDTLCFCCIYISRDSELLEHAGHKQMDKTALCGCVSSDVGHCRDSTRRCTYARGTQKLQLLCSLCTAETSALTCHSMHLSSVICHVCYCFIKSRIFSSFEMSLHMVA